MARVSARCLRTEYGAVRCARSADGATARASRATSARRGTEAGPSARSRSPAGAGKTPRKAGADTPAAVTRASSCNSKGGSIRGWALSLPRRILRSRSRFSKFFASTLDPNRADPLVRATDLFPCPALPEVRSAAPIADCRSAVDERRPRLLLTGGVRAARPGARDRSMWLAFV